MLVLVTGVCQSCGTAELCRKTAEMPVKLKMFRLANRMFKYVDRDFVALYTGGRTDTARNQRMTLRTGKTTGFAKWKGVDRKDLGDAIYMYSHLYNDSEDKKLYAKGSPERLDFDLQQVLDWVKHKNAQIAEIILERLAGERT